MIALKNISKSYANASVLSDLSLRIDPGACLCVVGERGSGKTTMLRILIRAEDPSSGTVEVDGVNIRTLPSPILQLFRKRVGVIFQEPILLEHATIEENLGLPLSILNAPASLVQRNTTDLLRRIGLASKATLFPKDLSVSEQRLVCIARAIITAPMVILADEPLADLDSTQAQIVVELLSNMQRRGTTVLLLSRSAAVAKGFTAQVLTLKNGQLSKQQDAAPPAKAAMQDTHKILEETEIQRAFNPPDETDVPINSGTGSSGKRIRITSIGSNS